MANIKSAKKRINVIEKKTLRNKMIRSKVKTVIKKVEVAIVAGDKVCRSAGTCCCYIRDQQGRFKGHLPQEQRSLVRYHVLQLQLTRWLKHLADNYITLTQGFGYIKRSHIFEPIIVI